MPPAGVFAKQQMQSAGADGFAAFKILRGWRFSRRETARGLAPLATVTHESAARNTSRAARVA